MTKIHRRTVIAARVCFLIYLALLVYFLFLMESRESTYRGYNLIPFKSIRMFFEYYFIYHQFSFEYWFLNIFGNIFLLLPFGMLLPVILDRRLSRPRVFLASFFLTSAIELTQLYTGLGEMDVDDVILNVLGAMIGYELIRRLGPVLSRRFSRNS